jgi:fido (protein-threonine AMPylation protein)
MNQNNTGYTWKSITDIPENWEELQNPELYSLASIWKEQHAQLTESRSVKEFNERLLREWSIETGILERLYTIDRGTTQMLIEQGFDASLITHGATNVPVGELIAVIKDHRDAIEGLFDFVGSRRTLSLNYIKQLHQVITRNQKYVEGKDQFGNIVQMEVQRGEWKKWPNNPTRPDGLIHEYCPPIHVQSEMEKLVDLFNSHTNVPPEINAAWLHHRFAQIHPFQDGNGRVARALATIVFLQAGWFPVVINRDQRSEYIDALEAADHGNLLNLIALFGQNAKKSFSRALTLSEDVLHDEKALPAVMDSIVNIYESRRVETEKSFLDVEKLAADLVETTEKLLFEISGAFQKKLSKFTTPPLLTVTKSKPYNEFYYSMQIVEIAKELDYWANTTRKRMWIRLHLFDQFSEQKAQIVFSFHYLGSVNRGIMVSTGFIFFPENKPENLKEESSIEPRYGEIHRICNEPFYFSYKDSARNGGLKESYGKWLNDCLTVGLAEWARRL